MECSSSRRTGNNLLCRFSSVSVADLVHQLYQRIVYDDTLSNMQKNKVVMQFSDVDKRLVDGADEHLTVLDLALQVSGVLAET